MAFTVRPFASEADCQAAVDILAHYARTSCATLAAEEEVPSAAVLACKWRAAVEDGLPWLVAEAADGAVLGYCYVDTFRAKAGWRSCRELSVYIVPGHERRGLGRALLTRVIELSRAAGLASLVAVVTEHAGSNLASLALHTALGFNRAGLLHAAGRKLGMTVDVHFLQLEL